MRPRPVVGRIIVVHTSLAGQVARIDAARRGQSGVQIMTMGQLAGAVGGGDGFPKFVDLEVLRGAARETLLPALTVSAARASCRRPVASCSLPRPHARMAVAFS